MQRVLIVAGLVVFATSLFMRSVDPVLPQIAAGLAVDPATAALLSTAFALPYALLQPVLGPVADVLGKTRVMTACLLILVAAALVSGVTESFAVLLAMRVISGIASGGVFPAGLALVGDLVPIGQRQVAMSRLLFAAMTGNLLGSSAGGIIGDAVGWRGVFLAVGAIGAVTLVAALVGFRRTPAVHSPRVALKSVPDSYRTIFTNPRAKVCFSAVFLEGVFIFGVFPFIALLLLAGGEPRASIAGIVIAGFAVGGILYTFALGALLELFGQRRLMLAGGTIAAGALVVIGLGGWWPFQLAAFVALGLGFYLLHGPIQIFVTELAPQARGAATALHSTFFFAGHGVGPVYYGLAFAALGTGVSLVLGAAAVLAVAVACVRLLHDRPPDERTGLVQR